MNVADTVSPPHDPGYKEVFFGLYPFAVVVLETKPLNLAFLKTCMHVFKDRERVGHIGAKMDLKAKLGVNISI